MEVIIKPKIIISAIVNRADGTVEDLGEIVNSEKGNVSIIKNERVNENG